MIYYVLLILTLNGEPVINEPKHNRLYTYERCRINRAQIVKKYQLLQKDIYVFCLPII